MAGEDRLTAPVSSMPRQAGGATNGTQQIGLPSYVLANHVARLERKSLGCRNAIDLLQRESRQAVLAAGWRRDRMCMSLSGCCRCTYALKVEAAGAMAAR